MEAKGKKHVITQEDIMNLLDSCYEKCLNGIPKVSPSVEDMAADYLKKHKSTLTKINQKVGFRFITKFGTKGIINLGKLLPGVGAVVGGGLDLVETKIIVDRAYKWFLKGDFSVKGEEEDEAIEIDEADFENVSKNGLFIK